MMMGFLLGHLLHLSKTYWILLTIMVIMKPGFSLTKTRSYQRIIGTLIGAFCAAGILWITKNDAVIFTIMLICILGAYSFQTYHYVTSVVFMTPFIVFLLHFLHPADFENVTQRVLDTVIGGVSPSCSTISSGPAGNTASCQIIWLRPWPPTGLISRR